MLNLQSKYDLLNPISKSRESDVFLIRKKEKTELFLLKSIKQADGGETLIDLKKRFYREMDIVSSLDHPNIAKPSDTIIEDDNFSIIYPYEKGDTLAQLFEVREKFIEHDALNIAKQLLNALAYVHSRGIIHADINPHNIFITEKKGLQLLDFGFSLTEDEARKVPEGRIIGTFPYLSPEQMGFTKFKIDTRSDLYCTGIILSRMLAGKLPFVMKEESIKELLDATIKREVLPIKNVPRFMNSILIKGLRPTPIDRYQTAEGFLSDIEFAIEKIDSPNVEGFIAGQKDAIVAINRKRVFIVRENELEILCLGLGHVLKGKNQSFLLFGKSGIGKTEIVREFKAHVDETKFDFISAKSNRFTPTQPYSIFRQLIIELLLKLSTADKATRKAFKFFLTTELAGYTGVICRIIPEMRDWFDTVGEIDVIEKEKESDRTIHVLSLLFRTLSQARKLVVFIDDLQWVDRITFDIIRRSIEQQAPCMLICNYRTKDDENALYNFGIDLNTLGFNKIVGIKPFSKIEIDELVLSRFNKIKNAKELVELLSAKTDCVPFVLTEAIRFMVNNGMLSIGSEGWSFKSDNAINLPPKFDSVSLILNKIKVLTPEEKKFLQLASLIEGKFDCEIIEKLGGYPSTAARSISARLENIGFLTMQLKGGYAFIHDKVQESVASGISHDDRQVHFELLGKIYLHKAETDKEIIFNAAECYLKSKNISMAMEVSYQAAIYASEKIAFDIAIRYFKSAALMANNAEKTLINPSIDLIKFNMAFGDVLMLTGANEQALVIFENLVEDSKLGAYHELEVKYKIGVIYHNLGEFEKSITQFINALNLLNVKFIKNRAALILGIICKIVFIVVVPRIFKGSLKSRDDSWSLLKSRILNKLSYSLYFSDMVSSLQLEFISTNYADCLKNTFEKAEAYSMHAIAAYQILLKKRAFKFIKKALKISQNINRKDCLAFAQSFGGLVYYYHAEWKKSEYIFKDSINNYVKIGDVSNQILSNEHLWKINLMKGLLKESVNDMQGTIELCNKVNQKYYLVVTLSARNFTNLISSGNCNEVEFVEIEDRLKNVNSSLFHIEAGGYLLQTEILTGKLENAYFRSKKLLPLILIKCVNSEYQVKTYSLYCNLIILELHNRLKGQTQIQVSSGKLKKSFILNSFILWFSCLSYPAYWGSFYRNIAWFFALLKRKRIAQSLFQKAVKCHHNLDMRYEEACSIRDYGSFLEDFCNLPGKARDMFNKAYELFTWCGAKFETDKLEGKVDFANKSSVPIKTDTAREKKPSENTSGSSSGVNPVRLDTILDTSASMTEINDVDVLLKQIVMSMMTATGAQYGCLEINLGMNDYKSVAMSFEGKTVPTTVVPMIKHLVNKVNETQKLQVLDEGVWDEDEGADSISLRSDLCVALNWRDKYLGYVYLVNDKVQGLFGEGAQKSAQILATQAGILLENALLMNRYKELNVHLQQQVESQTRDIISKNQQLEDFSMRVVDSERMKNLLSGTLVHDIKNYIAGIEGNIKLLAMKCPDHEKIQRTSAIVSNCCVDIVNLTSNLLDIAKMEEGKLEIKKEVLSIDKISSIVEKYQAGEIFQERGLTVSVKLPEKPFAIEADSYLLDRVLQNLFSNALKYAPRGGTVVLSFEPSEKENIICFYNSGNPIPDAFKEMLFEKYSRLEDHQSQYSKGLGLFFCRMVMQAHDGRIWLDTDPTGNAFKMSFRPVPFFLLKNDSTDNLNDGKSGPKRYSKAM